MKKQILTLLFSLIATSAWAQTPPQTLQPIPGVYFGGGYGWVNSINGDDKFRGDPREEDFFSIFGGGTFFQVFRAEAELLHMRTDGVRSQHQSSTRLNALAFNGYAGLPIKYIRPYIGLGLGFGWMDINYPNQSIYQSGTHGCTLFQAMLGVDIDIPQSPVKISAEWRSLIASENESDDDWDDPEDELTLHGNLFQVKARYQF
ncbi:MAG: porin family protein [Alphaproteobacteria bacterium]|nr:porin family protein [Alphaproteobacteria bacterium]MBN2780020.1 porin family protein [Alphaproteobacteria bacterium]